MDENVSLSNVFRTGKCCRSVARTTKREKMRENRMKYEKSP